MTSSKKKQKSHNKKLTENQILELIESQPEEIQETITKTLIAEHISYQGPIPPPQLLREFNDIIPNGADRIMKMAEQQSRHRMDSEKNELKAKNRDSLLGMLIAGVIAIISICGAFWLLVNDKSISGYITLFTTLAILVGVFVTGKPSNDKEKLEEQSEEED